MEGRKVLTPKRWVQPIKEVVKDKIAESVDPTLEIKILRETLAKVLEKVTIDSPEEFNEYNDLICQIKSETKEKF